MLPLGVTGPTGSGVVMISCGKPESHEYNGGYIPYTDKGKVLGENDLQGALALAFV